MLRLTTTWENFKAKFGEAIAPAASGLLEGITNMLKAGETMGPALNRLGVATGTAKPSDLVKPKATAPSDSASGGNAARNYHARNTAPKT
jgi:type IV pilus biogenesis protein CpaD/CtpE